MIVLGLVYLVVRNRRGGGEKPEAAGEPAADASR